MNKEAGKDEIEKENKQTDQLRKASCSLHGKRHSNRRVKTEVSRKKSRSKHRKDSSHNKTAEVKLIYIGNN